MPHLQALFRQLIYHRYVSNPLNDFVDLLFLSNISCIILDQRLAGYYMHGRNQAQFSDTSLQAWWHASLFDRLRCLLATVELFTCHQLLML